MLGDILYTEAINMLLLPFILSVKVSDAEEKLLAAVHTYWSSSVSCSEQSCSVDLTNVTCVVTISDS